MSFGPAQCEALRRLDIYAHQQPAILCRLADGCGRDVHTFDRADKADDPLLPWSTPDRWAIEEAKRLEREKRAEEAEYVRLAAEIAAVELEMKS